MAKINLIESLEMEYIKLAKEIWIAEFSLADIPPPQLKMELVESVKGLAHQVLLSCYMPATLISTDSDEHIEEHFYYPINLFNHFKSSLKNRLPSFLGKFINIKSNRIPIIKQRIVRKIGVHPSYFDIEHSLSKIYFMR